jgi:hypothetical protein
MESRRDPNSAESAMAVLEPEEIAHVLSEITDPATKTARRTVLCEMVGIDAKLFQEAGSRQGQGGNEKNGEVEKLDDIEPVASGGESPILVTLG